MRALDIDGNELRVGDAVELADSAYFCTRVGNRGVVTNIRSSNTLTSVSGLPAGSQVPFGGALAYSKRYRKVIIVKDRNGDELRVGDTVRSIYGEGVDETILSFEEVSFGPYGYWLTTSLREPGCRYRGQHYTKVVKPVAVAKDADGNDLFVGTAPAPTSAYPDDNPKSITGATKAPLHLNPSSAAIHQAAAHADGAAKYGPFNWRDRPVAVSVYISAIKRHLDAYYDDSEQVAADSGVHHLGHAMAGLAILLDAEAVGTLVDDRPKAGATVRLQTEYAAKQQRTTL